MLQRLSLALGLLVFVTGCATQPKFTPMPSDEPESDVPRIDFSALKKNLKLDRDASDLGYADRYFYTCQAGAGFSSTKDCHSEYLVVIHFQLLCRNSEGTISSLTHSEMAPLSGRTVRWTLPSINGVVITDQGGYGQIVTLANRQMHNQRLKLAADDDFLYMKAGEIRRVVTPQPWCNQ